MIKIHIEKFNSGNIEFMSLAHRIRKDVFVKEQGVDEKLEIDGNDNEATHYLAFKDDEPIATARYRITKNGFKLERFAVLPDYRNLKIGQMILDEILKELVSLKTKIYLHAQAKAVKFYLKNGFVIVGAAFYEAGIEHYEMELKKETC